jgi:hypothetical protein
MTLQISNLAQTSGRHNGRAKSLLSMLVALSLAVGTIGASASSAFAASGLVSFSASYSGAAAQTSPTSFGISGTGVASLLGKSTEKASMVVTGSSDSCPGGLANTETDTLTAADGDMLALTSTNVACPIGSGVFHGSGHWVVTGGTGRFQGATGAGTIDGSVDLAHGTFACMLTGNISAPIY